MTTEASRSWSRYGVAAAVLIWVAASSRWVSVADGTRLASDTASYLPMAQAAPGLPVERLSSPYAQRLPVHWVIGSLAHVLGLDVDVAYRVASILAVVAVAMLLCSVLDGLGVGLVSGAVGLAVVLLNPYALRIYFTYPVMITDLTYVVGIGMSLWGLVTRRMWGVMLGVVVAIASRQTALFSMIGIAAWLLTDRDWLPQRRHRVGTAAGAIVLTIGLYEILRFVGASFSDPFEPSLARDTIFSMFADPSASLGDLVQHVARAIAPVFVGVALAVTAGVVATRRGWRPRRDAVVLGSATATALLLVLQPTVESPLFPGLAGNEARLAALALFPLAMVVAVVVQRALGGADPRWTPTTNAAAVVGAAAFVLMSLSHDTSLFGPSPGTAYVIVQAACAAVLVVCLLATLTGWRGRPGRASEAPPAGSHLGSERRS